MKTESLERGIELDKEITVIKQAILDLERVQNSSKFEEYWAVLAQHKDGSGWRADMTGARIASAIVKAVESELRVQLKKREKEFAEL